MKKSGANRKIFTLKILIVVLSLLLVLAIVAAIGLQFWLDGGDAHATEDPVNWPEYPFSESQDSAEPLPGDEGSSGTGTPTAAPGLDEDETPRIEF